MSKSRSLNKVMLIGNLTRSPVIKETSSNIVVCSLGLATNTSWKDKDGTIKERTEYHNLVAFNKLAEICANVLDVGMLVYIEGELRSRIYEDSSGHKVTKTEIKVNDMYVLDAKGKKGVGYENAKLAGSSNKSSEARDVDIVDTYDDVVDRDSDDVDSKALF